MKTYCLKILLMLIVIFNISSANAQYQSIFGSFQTSWNVYSSELAGEFTDSLTVCCDTSINNKSYKIINYYKFYTPNNPLLQSIIGFLREDTISGRAWYFTSSDTNERLIMDLSLTLADSFQVFNMNSSGGIFYQVDSIYTKNGKKHIRLNVIPNYLNGLSNEKFTMIEGVGPNISILFSDNNWPIFNPYLLCSYKDNNIEYQNTSPTHNGQCSSFSTSIKKSSNHTEIRIYPNPSAAELTIEYKNDNHNALTIEIYNSIGKLELIQKVNTVGKTTINTNNIPTGIYFISIKDKQNIITTKKWIKTE